MTLAVQKKPFFLAWFMWIPPLLFFAYQFILRLWPSLTMQQIMEQYTIDATAFGFLSAIYYLGYAGMQIPVAVLLDRFNPRYLIAGFAILAGCSAYVFNHADHWSIALAARFLIGVTSAIGFLGTSKAISSWFPENLYARMIGFSFTFGLMGALYGGRPVNALIDRLGFVDTSTIIALAGVMIGLLIILFYRQPSNRREESSYSAYNLRDLKEIFTHPTLLLIALVNFLMVGALEGFADVWGVTFLVTAYKVPKDSAAGIISFIYIGMLFGGPVLAFLSERLGGSRVIFLCGAGIASLFTLMLFSCNALSPFMLQGLLFVMGILCCYQVIVFALTSHFIRPELAGISIAFMNCINMLGGSFFHTVIGFVADKFWTGTVANGCRIYDSTAYTYALICIPLCALVGGILMLKVRTGQK